MPDDNQIGLESVYKDSGFNKGIGEYTNRVAQATQATDQASSVMSSGLGGSLSNLTQMIPGPIGQLSTLTSELGLSKGMVLGLVAGLGGLLVIGGAVALSVAAVGMAFKVASLGIKEFIDYMFVGENSAVMVASRVEELNLIAQTLGQNMGYTGEQVNGFVKNLESTGISAMVANKAITDFMRAQLDLNQVTELGKVAQNAAAIAATDSSTALQSLTYAIETLNIESLRTYGIVVNSDQAYKQYADSIGKAASELTGQERQQAMLNAVIAEGAKIQGAYDAAMETGIKQLGTMSGRLLPDLKAAMGAPFQEAFFNVTKGINNIIEAITKMVSEGGVLYPLLVKLGAIAQVITEPFKGLGDTILGLGEPGGPIDNAAQGIMNFIDQAFEWGVNLITNFATGIIDGASTALVGAINWVSNLLTSWFAPGSPPKILPDIDLWGAKTIEEWLKGFTQADFSTLKDIQGPLKAALDFQESIGALGEGMAGQAYVNISKGLIDMIENGSAAGKVFDTILKSAGEFGSEIVKLTKLEFEEAQAEKDVAAAQERMKKAAEDYVKAGTAVNQGILEYNQMLRSGATKDQLAAKLKEINANRAAQKLAATNLVQADKDLSTAEGKVDLLKEQIDLQKQLVQVLMDLYKAQAKAAPKEAPVKAPGAGGKGAAKGIGAGGPATAGTFDVNTLLNPMREAVDKAAQDMKNRISTAWWDIKFKVMMAWFDLVDKVSGAWDKLVGILSPKWEAFKITMGGVWETIKLKATEVWGSITTAASNAWTWIQTRAQAFGAVFTGWWQRHGENIKFVVTSIWNAITQWLTTTWNNLTSIWNVVAGIFGTAWNNFWGLIRDMFTNTWNTIVSIATTTWDLIKTVAGNTWDAIKVIFSNTWDSIKTVFSNALEIIGNVFDGFALIFKGDWAGAWEEVKTNFSLVWDTIKTLFRNTWDTMKTIVNTSVENVKSVLSTAWDNIKSVIDTAWFNIKSSLETAWTNIKSVFSNAWNTFRGFGQDILNGLSDGISSAISGAIRTVTGAAQSVIDAVMKLLGLGSPSRLFAEFGEATMKGMAIGIQQGALLPKKAVVNAMVGMSAPAAVPIMSGATNYYQQSVTFAPKVTNGIDSAVLESRVRSIVKKELGRR